MSKSVANIYGLVERMEKWRGEYYDVLEKHLVAKDNRTRLAAEFEAADTLYDELDEKIGDLEMELEELKTGLDNEWEVATTDFREPEDKPQVKKKGKK